MPNDNNTPDRTIYAVRDKRAHDVVGNQAYALMLFKNDMVAIRYFSDALAEESSVLHKHPDDYELIAVGAMADDGTLYALDEPAVIISGDQVLAAQNRTVPEGVTLLSDK